MSVTTKTGDGGQTSLYTGERVDKDSQRVETYGTIDELGSALAMARAFAGQDEVRDRIFRLQQQLSLLMADFASCDQEPRITADSVRDIETEIAAVEGRLPALTRFLIAGDTKSGAMLDMARSTARRAERRACRLTKEEPVADSDCVFLNRLSDYIFLLMRLEEQK